MRNGANRYFYRFTCRGDSRPALAGRGLFQPVNPGSASHLPGFAGLSQDQRQQTYPTPSGNLSSGFRASPARLNPNRRSGVSHQCRYTLQRYEPARPSSQTGRPADRNPVAGLAYPATDSRTPALAIRSLPKDAQAQLGHAHISTTMDIYTQPTPAHQWEAVEKMAQLVTNGDELAVWPEMANPQTSQIQRFIWWAQQDSNLRLPPCESTNCWLYNSKQGLSRHPPGSNPTRRVLCPLCAHFVPFSAELLEPG